MSAIVEASALNWPQLPTEGKDYLNRIIGAADRMAQLTDGLLSLARVSRNELHRKPVDLGQMAGALLDELQLLDAQTFEQRLKMDVSTW